jgi:hypothetical protein
MAPNPTTTPAVGQTNGNTAAVGTLSPTENKEKQPESVRQENGVSPNPAGQAPKIDVLVHTVGAEESTLENGAAAAETNPDRPESMSPGGTTKKGEGPADIPSQKLAFGEDKRALKALDKVFI